MDKKKEHPKAWDTFNATFKIGDEVVDESHQCSYVTFGDPFHTECSSMQRFNPGWHLETQDQYDAYYDYEEVLSLVHLNGARALLWDVPTIFEFCL